MRWAALGVDFEMFGKDHQTKHAIYDGICETLGGQPPEHYVYELFLDDIGQKISKSKGNGLTIDEWLAYASPESLALFMYQKPREAKRLYFDVIPQARRRVCRQSEGLSDADAEERLTNPVWHIHGGNPPAPDVLEPGTGDRKPKEISFALLINLASGAAETRTSCGVSSAITHRRPVPRRTRDSTPWLALPSPTTTIS